jgi:hypothetical protein
MILRKETLFVRRAGNDMTVIFNLARLGAFKNSYSSVTYLKLLELFSFSWSLSFLKLKYLQVFTPCLDFRHLGTDVLRIILRTRDLLG